MDSNNSFTYTYSAKQQEEIRKIREKYTAKGADQMTKLMQLDRSANLWGNLAAITLGTIGTLLFGIGMCYGLVWGGSGMAILCTVIGMCIAAPAYFVGKIINKRMKKKAAPEILALCDELMK